MKLLAVVILACVSFCAAAGAYEGRRANDPVAERILLNLLAGRVP